LQNIKSLLKLNTKDGGADLGASSVVSPGSVAWKGDSSMGPRTWVVVAQVDEARRQMHAGGRRMGGVQDETLSKLNVAF
jgi:hypothetical protein